MPKCDLCDIEEETLFKCSKCGKMFCDFCGSSEEKSCIDCLEEDDGYDDDNDYVDYDDKYGDSRG